jgi:cytochrome c oxidase assembly factor CtaG
MTTLHLLMTAWNWYPSVVVGCIGLLAVYLAAARPLSAAHTSCYAAGVLVILLALVSPIDPLSDNYLFSVHMIQHLLLDLIAPPLLLLGIPASLARRLLAHPRIARLERGLSRPAVAWTLGIGTLWVWHLPVLYNAALANENIHIAEHLCFMVTGTIFFWPVLCPLPERGL